MTRLPRLALVVSLCTVCLAAQPAPTYDIVLRNGRVMDPASGLDAVRNVAIAV